MANVWDGERKKNGQWTREEFNRSAGQVSGEMDQGKSDLGRKNKLGTPPTGRAYGGARTLRVFRTHETQQKRSSSKTKNKDGGLQTRGGT